MTARDFLLFLSLLFLATLYGESEFMIKHVVSHTKRHSLKPIKVYLFISLSETLADHPLLLQGTYVSSLMGLFQILIKKAYMLNQAMKKQSRRVETSALKRDLERSRSCRGKRAMSG